MNPRSKGWLKEYLEFRQKLFLAMTSEGLRSAHPDYSLYKVLQPTGLMYGQPVTPFEFSEAAAWNNRDRLKVLLAESLVSSSFIFNDRTVGNSQELSAVLLKTLESINLFYQQVFPELAPSARTFLGRKKETAELAEQILERRVDRLDLNSNFWVRFFQSSLLFLDVFIFGQWAHTHADKMVSDFFQYERDELRTSVVKIMAVAAHANENLSYEERKLLGYFLQSSGLSVEKRKECQEIFERGVPVEELQLPTNNSWILKKYFLEIAILTCWADRRVEANELDVLNRLAGIMGCGHDDVESSLLAVEGFVLEHWKELDNLQDKKSFEEVSQEFIQRMASIAARSKAQLMTEARASRELMRLLMRARSSELNSEEKESMRIELIGILRKIKSLAIITLPQHFLTLPVLMQIFPKNFVADVLTD